jgi:hypothetical protein
MNIRPFTKGYILRNAARDVHLAIDRQIKVTFNRMIEFQDNPEKSSEIFVALSTLHSFRKHVIDFQKEFENIFEGP